MRGNIISCSKETRKCPKTKHIKQSNSQRAESLPVLYPIDCSADMRISTLYGVEYMNVDMNNRKAATSV